MEDKVFVDVQYYGDTRRIDLHIATGRAYGTGKHILTIVVHGEESLGLVLRGLIRNPQEAGDGI